MKIFYSTLLLFALTATILTGCGKKVTRTSTDSVTDLSGNWNDTDSRLVAEEVLNTCLTAPWYQEKSKDGRPIIVVGQIRNLSHEHINTNTFINDIQRVLINSGKVRFVANSEERQQLRSEIDDQRGNATDETAKERGQETGADIMLTGTINSIIDQSGGTQVKFYQVDLELIDLQSHEKLWIGGKKHKKVVEKSALKL
ncbi:MAG: penicillin-binding protein activator LpoB [Fibromonadales bacterium]|nr:penicillin-binding protein activator LpoB [Fibromonadales bacterium]